MKREFSGFAFECVGPVDPEKDVNGKILELMPESVGGGTGKSSLTPDLKGPFCRFYISADFPYPGIYIITVNGDVQYVNECQNLSERFNALGYGTIYPKNAFFTDRRVKCRINHLILQSARQGDIPELWFLRSLRDRKEIKGKLIRRYRPDWNQQVDNLA